MAKPAANTNRCGLCQAQVISFSNGPSEQEHCDQHRYVDEDADQSLAI